MKAIILQMSTSSARDLLPGDVVIPELTVEEATSFASWIRPLFAHDEIRFYPIMIVGKLDSDRLVTIVTSWGDSDASEELSFIHVRDFERSKSDTFWLGAASFMVVFRSSSD